MEIFRARIDIIVLSPYCLLKYIGLSFLDSQNIVSCMDMVYRSVDRYHIKCIYIIRNIVFEPREVRGFLQEQSI